MRFWFSTLPSLKLYETTTLLSHPQPFPRALSLEILETLLAKPSLQVSVLSTRHILLLLMQFRYSRSLLGQQELLYSLLPIHFLFGCLPPQLALGHSDRRGDDVILLQTCDTYAAIPVVFGRTLLTSYPMKSLQLF